MVDAGKTLPAVWKIGETTVPWGMRSALICSAPRQRPRRDVYYHLVPTLPVDIAVRPVLGNQLWAIVLKGQTDEYVRVVDADAMQVVAQLPTTGPGFVHGGYAAIIFRRDARVEPGAYYLNMGHETLFLTIELPDVGQLFEAYGDYLRAHLPRTR